MGSLHFVGGEKGGVGKSFTSRLLAQYFIDHQQPFVGFDTDESHATFSRFYTEFTKPIEIDSFDSLDHIIEYAEANPEHQIIVDLAAQTFKPLKKWFEESEIHEIFAELGYDIYLWHVMDDGADSMFLLDKLMNTYPQELLNLIVVQNYGRGREFENFEESDVYKKAQVRPAKFLQILELQAGLARKIDFNNASFWNASHSHGMSIAERQRTKVWLKKHYEQIDACLSKNAAADSQPQLESPQAPLLTEEPAYQQQPTEVQSYDTQSYDTYNDTAQNDNTETNNMPTYEAASQLNQAQTPIQDGNDFVSQEQTSAQVIGIAGEIIADYR
ncbi:MAG: hypothetical protein MI976_31210 [Pseudomonadales bacterium]|nr:hypothetical protein [Pseudomonadales bacterium]